MSNEQIKEVIKQHLNIDVKCGGELYEGEDYYDYPNVEENRNKYVCLYWDEELICAHVIPE